MMHRNDNEFPTANRQRRSIFPVIIALYILFFLLFTGILPIGFWELMSSGVLCLTIICFFLDPCYLDRIRIDVRTGVFQKILFGIGSALALYGIFLLGNFIFRSVLPETSAFIDSVYALRTDHSQVILILLLACIIGPGEELIWRGYIQHHAGLRWSPRFALVTSILLYTLAHIPSGNPVLLIAALVCGMAWSLIYYVSGSLLINIISHAVWDVMVFILFPL